MRQPGLVDTVQVRCQSKNQHSFAESPLLTSKTLSIATTTSVCEQFSYQTGRGKTGSPRQHERNSLLLKLTWRSGRVLKSGEWLDHCYQYPCPETQNRLVCRRLKSATGLHQVWSFLNPPVFSTLVCGFKLMKSRSETRLSFVQSGRGIAVRCGTVCSLNIRERLSLSDKAGASSR